MVLLNFKIIYSTIINNYTSKERGKIEALKEVCYSNRQIAKKIKRLYWVVNN